MMKIGSSIDHKRTSSSQRKINSIEKATNNLRREPLLKLSKGKNGMKSTKTVVMKKKSEKEIQINPQEILQMEQQHQINTQSNMQILSPISMSTSSSSSNPLNANKKNTKRSIDDNLSTKVSSCSSKFSVESLSLPNNQDYSLFNFDAHWGNEDNNNKNKLQYQYENLNEIYLNLLQEERTQEIVSQYGYMESQTNINEQMRAILIDWLIDVHLKFKFTESTLYMTIDIVDKYLSMHYIQRSKLQLLGVTALFLSCKHEEINVPKIEEFAYVTDDAYVKAEILQMESEILQVLRFGLLSPSPQSFYEILSLALGFNKKQFCMGKYLMESFTLGYKINKYSSSVISCAAAYVVMKYFKLEKYQICYDKRIFNFKTIDSGVKDCAKDICCFVNHLDTESSLTAAKKKFSSDDYENVSFLSFN